MSRRFFLELFGSFGICLLWVWKLLLYLGRVRIETELCRLIADGRTTSWTMAA